MSTKIHHGWRIDGRSLESLLGPLKKFGNAVRRTAEDIIYAEAARRATFLADISAFRRRNIAIPIGSMGDSSLHCYAMSSVDVDLRESFESSQRGRLDIQCSATFHPIDGAILALLFDNTAGSVYEPLFRKILGAKPYPYWDNSDMPSNISKAEWARIGKNWDTALGDGVPAENGFIFECMSKHSRPVASSPDKLVAAVPSFLDRVDAIAQEIVVTSRTNILLRKMGRSVTTPSKPEKASRYVQAVFDASSWMKNDPAGIAAMKYAVRTAKSRLKRMLGKSDFSAPLSAYCGKD